MRRPATAPALDALVPSSSSSPFTILRRPVVARRIGVSGTTVWRMVRAGEFPPPLHLSAHTIGWLETDINDWIAKRAAAADRSIPRRRRRR